MNIIELARQSGMAELLEEHSREYGSGTFEITLYPELEKFAELVEAQEREAWEQKFARLQNLMDIREIQPNKPCCLAARAEEREVIMKSIEELNPVENNPILQNKPAAFWIENFRQIVYARGTP